MAIGTAAAIIGGSVASSLLGGRAASKAASKQAAAAKEAAAARSGSAQQGIDLGAKQLQDTNVRLDSARNVATRSLNIGLKEQQAQLNPFAKAGLGALEQQQALLGLGTPEQQAAAQAALTETPGQKFIRDRQQKALLRGAAATGGLRGGNVLTALQQQAAGFAQQSLGDQQGHLQNLIGGGQNAASELGRGALQNRQQIASVVQDAAFNRANFGAQNVANTANLLGAQGTAQAAGIQQAGAARAQGSLNRNQALQSGIGGVFSGLSSGGFLGGGGVPAGGSAISAGQFNRGSGLGGFTF